jgi:hypothetical protein
MLDLKATPPKAYFSGLDIRYPKKQTQEHWTDDKPSPTPKKKLKKLLRT